jgi:hypothetical protein
MQDKTRQGRGGQGKAMQGKAGQGKAGQGNYRKVKSRQGEQHGIFQMRTTIGTGWFCFEISFIFQ